MNNEKVSKNLKQEKAPINEKDIKIKSLEAGWKSVALAMVFLVTWRIIHNETPIDILIKDI